MTIRHDLSPRTTVTDHIGITRWMDHDHANVFDQREMRHNIK